MSQKIKNSINSMMNNKPPVDRWQIVKMVFFLHGISALLPWNMLIDADRYFVDYKLLPVDTSNSTNSDALENYRRNFLPYLSTASKVPNIMFQIINLFFASSSKSYRIRMNLTFLGQIGMFLIMILFAFIDTSSWPEIFFWLTMVIAVLFNTVNGIFQSCIYGIGAKFPMEYINYITFGFSFSGTIAAIFLIVSLWLSPHPRTVAIYYFSFATVFMSICYINEIFLLKNRFFYYYFQEENLQKPLEMVTDSDGKQTKSIKKKNQFQIYLLVIRKCWVQIFNSLFIYIVSFSIFPAIQADTLPLQSLVDEKFFVPIFCFFFFSTFCAVGNLIAERVRRPGPSTLVYFVLLRVVFIPFFIYCNYIPERRKIPVLFTNDIVYVIGSALFALSSGYLSSLAMMYAPKCLPEHASKAGMIASLAILIGIVIGVQCSMLIQHFVT